MDKNIKTIIQALGVYQIFGGFLGIFLAVRVFPQLKDVSGASMAMIAFAGFLYLFSIVCGFVLFKNTRRGLTLSLGNQVLQVLNFAVGSFAYNYVAGFKLGFGIDFVPNWQLKLNLSLSSFQFAFNTETGRVFIGINLLALFLVYLIERLREQKA